MSERLILDTHVLLSWLAAEPISSEAADAIADPSNAVAVSAASIWEITIKRQVGTLRFEGSPADEVRDAGFEHLSITAAHAELAGGLPLRHRDPFDRMLVAQARADGWTLVSRDAAFSLYDVRVLACRPRCTPPAWSRRRRWEPSTGSVSVQATDGPEAFDGFRLGPGRRPTYHRTVPRSGRIGGPTCRTPPRRARLQPA